MNIIGISAFYHESACCLMRNGRLIAAAEEERFSRLKHDPKLPVAAFRYCLQAGGLDITDIDCIGYYESPEKKLSRQLWAGRKPSQGIWFDPGRPIREIREVLGFEGRIECFEHHLSHAASSYCFSGFDEAAILTVDGVGEWATTTYGHAKDGRISLLKEVDFPDSLGLFYSTITSYLGFAVNNGEYKVMGLAPYGKPRFMDELREVLKAGSGGDYRLAPEFFDFVRGKRMFSDELTSLLGRPPRAAESDLEEFHYDVARSAQLLLEEVLLEKVDYLHSITGCENLCMAGGVALNCVANGRIAREGPFSSLFVQPAAGDSGACLGAAALAHLAVAGRAPQRQQMQHACLGPAYLPEMIARLLESSGLGFEDHRHSERELVAAVASRLCEGRVIGWFQGAMEFGPRALGNRSIIADPRRDDMRDHVNRVVKKREGFRPFAPSVLASEASRHLELDHPSPFMLETCQVRSELSLPAITHVDGSARPQTVDPKVTPRYAALLEAFFARTGCPILLNTSFNVRDEPIVCSPVDAIRNFVHSDLDVLVLEDFIIDREKLPDTLLALTRTQSEVARRQAAISSALYTFV